MSVINNAKERSRFIRFGIVGIIGSVIDFGVFNLLANIFFVPSTYAVKISFILAVINNFILNRYWTFSELRKTPITKPLIQFSIVSLIGLAIRTLLFPTFENFLIQLAQKAIPHILTPKIVGSNLALAILIGIVMLWNYFANRFWTFKNVPS